MLLHVYGLDDDDANEDSTLEMCKGDPVVSCTTGRRDSDQEVPL